MRIIFLGPPGAGKGTQSQKLLAYLQVPHIATGDMLRRAIQEQSPMGRTSEDYMRRGRLVPDPIILDLVAARLAQPDCDHGCMFDGFPRTLTQAEALDEILNKSGMPLSGVLELKVDRDELLRRLLGRRRADDKPEVIRERLDGYLEQTAPLVGILPPARPAASDRRQRLARRSVRADPGGAGPDGTGRACRGAAPAGGG